MRRLLPLVCVLVLVDTMLYAALTPLLPHFAAELHLSKAAAGLLVAAYAAGALVGALPGGLAAVRMGPRRAVLAGLALMGCSILGFAFAHSYGALLLARFAQGVGSAFTWSGAFAWLLAVAPVSRRGEMIGTAMGAAVAGELLGPVVGAVAALAGRTAIFTALAGLAVVLAIVTMRIASAPPEDSSLAALRGAIVHRPFALGIGLLALGSLLFGMLAVLGPLHLAGAGWGAAAIGAVWLLGGAVEASISPLLGRISDRRGPLWPVRRTLRVCVPVSLALVLGVGPLAYAALLVLASCTYGTLFTPAFALIAEGAEDVKLAQGMAFGVLNAAWAIGAMVGPAAAGAIAAATGEQIPFVLAAGACAVALAIVAPVGVAWRSRQGYAR
jgi:MFS family permease